MALTCVFTATNSPYLAEKCTGLGNVLFQIASIYGLARDTNRTAEYVDLENLCSKIKQLTGDDYTKTIFRNVPTDVAHQYHGKVGIPHNYNDNFKEKLIEFINQNSSRNICFEGHFESHEYFSKYENELKFMFSPDENSLRAMPRELFTKTCGSIHIRKYHTSFTDDINYIKRAIESLPSDVTYIVMSNDIEAVEKELGNNFIYSRGNFDYVDMWIMSLCKYNIMSHSTMSWWGAYLNQHKDKVVVCPKTMQNIYPGPISNFYLKDYIFM